MFCRGAEYAPPLPMRAQQRRRHGDIPHDGLGSVHAFPMVAAAESAAPGSAPDLSHFLAILLREMQGAAAGAGGAVGAARRVGRGSVKTAERTMRACAGF